MKVRYFILFCLVIIDSVAMAQMPTPNLVADSVAKKIHVKTVQGRFRDISVMVINEKYNTRGQIVQSTANCKEFESRGDYYYNKKWQLIKHTYTTIRDYKRKVNKSSSEVYTYDDSSYELTKNGDTVHYIIKNGKKYHIWDDRGMALSIRDSFDKAGRLILIETIYPRSTSDMKWFIYNDQGQVVTKKDFLYLPNLPYPATFEYSYTYNKKGLVIAIHEIEDGSQVTNSTYSYTFY
jgi:hypothetical protein